MAAWNGAVDALLAKGSVSLEELKAAVDDGAAAHRADVRYLAPGGAAAVSTDRLAALVASHAAAKAWHAACAEQLAKPVSPDVLAALLDEGAKVPLVTLAEMADLRGRLERMRAWEAAAQRVVGQPAEMRELTELQREAEALRIKTDEAEGLSSRTAACRKWMGRIHNELLRRTSSRKAVVVRLTVAEVEGLIGEAATLQLSCEEIAQAQEKLEEAAAWSEEARAVLEPPAPVTPEVFDHLNDLAKRIEVINMNLAEQGALDDRLGLVRDWMARAKAARADGESPWQLLMGLVKEAKGSGIQLPEVKLLAEQQAEAAWLGQAELALSGAAQLDDLEQLESDAARLAESPKAVEFAGRISEKLALARRWGERLEEEAVGGSARPGLKEAVSLVSECEADKVLLPQLEALKGTVAQAKAWIDSVRRTQSRSTRGVAVRATLPEMRALFEHGQSLPLSLPEGGTLAIQIHEAEEWGHRAEAALGAHPDDAAAKAAAAVAAAKTARAARARGGAARAAAAVVDDEEDEAAELAAAAEAASAPPSKEYSAELEEKEKDKEKKGGGGGGGGGGVPEKRLKELVVQSDNLSIAVGVSATLRLRAWRVRVKHVRNGGPRHQLRDLTDLLAEGRTLYLDAGATPRPPPEEPPPPGKDEEEEMGEPTPTPAEQPAADAATASGEGGEHGGAADAAATAEGGGDVEMAEATDGGAADANGDGAAPSAEAAAASDAAAKPEGGEPPPRRRRGGGGGGRPRARASTPPTAATASAGAPSGARPRRSGAPSTPSSMPPPGGSRGRSAC